MSIKANVGPTEALDKKGHTKDCNTRFERKQKYTIRFQEALYPIMLNKRISLFANVVLSRSSWYIERFRLLCCTIC